MPTKGLSSLPIPHSDENCYSREDKYLSKINYTFRSSFCLLPIASCLSSLGNLFCMTTYYNLHSALQFVA
ncbi:MAG: hypothetical protein EWV62_16895 [Microcystis aeruginosa Ma_OC_LR_19540900_S633]|nr:MAG: hypothetical protein EWV62_16895 [Microcystis aeruginosa Ma_OC_LR_19540900_S633]